MIFELIYGSTTSTSDCEFKCIKLDNIRLRERERKVFICMACRPLKTPPHYIQRVSIFQCHTRKRCQKWIWFFATSSFHFRIRKTKNAKYHNRLLFWKRKFSSLFPNTLPTWARHIMRFYIECWRWLPKTQIFTYRHKIFDTHPCETRNCREITQGRMPMAAISTILWRIWFGKGRPFMKTPPSWLTRPWPESIKPKKMCLV